MRDYVSPSLHVANAFACERPGYEFASWQLALAPAGTLPEVLARSTVRSSRGRSSAAPHPKEASAFLKDEVARWGKILRERGIKAD